MIVGLAPGLRGANRTGRPFTGDAAGDLLYATLLAYGFAAGVYDRRPDDGLALVDCAIAAIVALGRVAHDSALRALDARPSRFPFTHGARHKVAQSPLVLFDSYHCSRYNTNTGTLTPEMFRAVFAAARAHLDAPSMR